MSDSRAVEIGASSDAVEVDASSWGFEIDEASPSPTSHSHALSFREMENDEAPSNEAPSDEAPSMTENYRPPRKRSRRILLCVFASAALVSLSSVATGAIVLLKRRSDEASDIRAAGSTVAALGPPSAMEEETSSDDRTAGPSFEHATLPATSGPASSPGAVPEMLQRDTQAPSRPPSMRPTTRLPTDGPTTDGWNPLTFYAIGDVPYSDMEACLLPHELRKLSASEGRFLVHLGDIQDGRSTSCPESLYENVATIFESSPVPTLFVIGDNESLDCGEGSDASFAYWTKHLLRFHERTNDPDRPPLDASVIRHPRRPELFAFLLEGVLFLGQGLPSPQLQNMPDADEWNDLLRDNVNWTREHFFKNRRHMRAAVVFSHSSSGPAEIYFDELKELAARYEEVPILLVEDNHWFEEEVFRDTPNLYRIALDDTVTPASVTVDTSSGGGMIANVFRYDRRCWCSDDHRPTRLVSYTSGDCDGVCDTNELCFGENVCGMDGETCW